MKDPVFRPFKSPQENGSALFMVLIAVALFAALSYAITQSGRSGSGGTAKETSTLDSGKITDYASTVRTAVMRMALGGNVLANTINYTNGATGTTAVFDAAGGGVAWVASAPPAIQDTAAIDILHAGPNWRFKAITSTANKGYYIAGIGSTTGQDAFAFVGVTKAACTAIQAALGIGIISLERAAAAAFDTTFDATESLPTHSLGYSQENPAGLFGAYDIGKYYVNIAGPPQLFACVSNDNAGNGPYIYYHGLLTQ